MLSVVRIRILIYFGVFFVCFGQAVLAQKPVSETQGNELRIKIIDVVERTPLCNLDLILTNEKDTLNIHVDSTELAPVELNFIGTYMCSIIKEGYDTLSTEWENSGDDKDFLLEFFAPKTSLTRKEKRTAHETSERVPELPCDYCGGFKSLTARHNEMCVVRLQKSVEGQRTGGSYIYKRLRDF